MGYYVRALCTSEVVPTLGEVQAWLKQHGSVAEISDADLESSVWERARLFYRRGKLPILVECNRDTGPDSLLREELEEFSEILEEVDPPPGKQTVVAHIAATKFLIACQLPTSDIDDDGYDANSDFLSFFEERCGGIVQADGEGFYRGEELLVEFE